MNSTSKSIVNLALATSLALVSVTGWSAEEAKATKKKSAKNAVASLHAGTSSSDMSMKPSAFRSRLEGTDQSNAGSGGLTGGTTATGSTDITTVISGGTGEVVEDSTATGSTDTTTVISGGTGEVVEDSTATGSTDTTTTTSGGTGDTIIAPNPEGSPS